MKRTICLLLSVSDNYEDNMKTLNSFISYADYYILAGSDTSKLTEYLKNMCVCGETHPSLEIAYQHIRFKSDYLLVVEPGEQIKGVLNIDKHALDQNVYAFRVFKDKKEKWDTRMFFNANFKLENQQKIGKIEGTYCITSSKKDDKPNPKSRLPELLSSHRSNMRDPNVLFQLAEEFKKMGKKDDAVAFYGRRLMYDDIANQNLHALLSLADFCQGNQKENYLRLAIKKYPKSDEAKNKLALILDSQGHHVEAKYIKNEETEDINHSLAQFYYQHCHYDKALKLLEGNKEASKQDLCLLLDIYYKIGRYQDSFNLAHRNMWATGSVDEDIEFRRDRCIDFIKDQYLIYPEDKINNIKVKDNPKILFTSTTCKRYDLFEKTINSFLNCVSDYTTIDAWFVFDDNSSDDDRKLMKKKYPFMNYVFKTEDQKGHVESMNMILDLITEKDIDYLVHIEDDFHFIMKQDYIGRAIKILEEDSELGQVLFNRNYLEIEPFKMRVVGGQAREVDDIRYLVHEHPDGVRKDGLNNYYWPHFSFRPCVMKASMLRDVGRFVKTKHFEMEYAHRYVAKGYKTGFFDEFNCIHIGKKTWEPGLNSYQLNNVSQF